MRKHIHKIVDNHIKSIVEQIQNIVFQRLSGLVIGDFSIACFEINAESLELFGITNIQVIEEGCKVKVPNLYVAQHIAPSGNFNPENVKKLRDFIWSKNKLDLKFSLGERIYISRSRAEFRYVINDTEVAELLKTYGFSVVYMEDYDLAQKVSVVYNAKYMVSIIGAAFSFVHFMRPGSSIMEFRKRNDGVNCIYWALADALDINYYYQYGDARVHHMGSYNFDLTMDVALLEKNIQQMLHTNGETI